VIFGGAYSGTYSIAVRHKHFGLVDTDDITLTVGSEVTSYSPKTGSIYGGTLLTIHGTNWDPKVKTNNPVQISYNGALGSSHCYVLTTAVDKITCRIQEFLEKDKKEHDKEGKMLVFLKTSEEAACTNPKCQYKFTNQIPTLTKIEKEWDGSNNYWTVKITGTEMTGTKTSTELHVNGKIQETLAVVPQQALFKVSNVDDLGLKNMKVYFDIGVPKGRDILTPELKLTAKLVSFNVQTGSPGGSLIIANVQGVGSKTIIKDLVYGGSKSMCKTVTVKSYGKVECLTHAKEIPTGSEMSFKLGDNSVVACGNSDKTKCHYS
jgi:hypothetical protein